MRDSQRQAVYRWEGRVAHLVNGSATLLLDLADCESLVDQVWRDYRPEQMPPRVEDGRGRRRPCGSRRRIKLPRFARSRIVVLHEIAHSLQTQQPWHGPQFARLVLELWARYAAVPKAEARSLGVHQKPRRVRFAPPKDVPQPVSREWKAWWQKKAALRAQLAQLNAAEPSRHAGGSR